MAGIIEAVLALRNTPFKQGLNDAKNDAQKFKKSTEGIFAGLGGKLAGALSVGAIVAAGKALLDFSGDLQDTSDSLNIGIEDLQRYQAAFADSGANAETFAKGLAKLNQSVAGALGGNEATIKAFEGLGISLDALGATADDPAKLLPLLADGMKNAANPAQALADVNELLGKSGIKMAGGLKMGGDQLQKLAADAEIASGKSVGALANIGDAIDNFVRTAKAQSVNIAGIIAGAVGNKDWWMGKRKAEAPSEPDYGAVTQPGETGAATSGHNGQGQKKTKPNLVNLDQIDPRRRAARAQEEKDQAAREKHLEEQGKLEKDAADIRNESMERYLGRQQMIAKLNKEIYDLAKKTKGNDPVAAAAARKEIAGKNADRLELLTQANLMSPNERREEKRSDRRRGRAVSQAGEQIKRELREVERRVRTGARRVGGAGQITDRKNEFDSLVPEVKLMNEKLANLETVLGEINDKTEPLS